jgi:tetratricopeptide (TPR) repeat protein
VAPLDEGSALELLGRIAGTDRTGRQPDAARAVVRLCGHLPLAVCVSAARLVPHPHWGIERVAQELESERQRLSALSLAGDVSVRTVFDMSYRALTPEEARAYRLAALIPGPDFGPALAEAAVAAGEGLTGSLLDGLAEASLLQENGERRYRFHDLVRVHAREQSGARPQEERRAAVERITDWHLKATVAADLTVVAGRWHLGGAYERTRQEPARFDGPPAALDWLESELPGIVAAVGLAARELLHEKVWQICEALWGLLVYRGPSRLWTEAVFTGLASARACGDRRAQARMLVYLGFAHLRLGAGAAAREQFTEALELDRAEGNHHGEATALDNLGLASLSMGDPDSALEYFTQARSIHEQIGRPRGAALMTRRIGEAHRDAGWYQQAVSYLLDACDRFAALADPYNQARSLTAAAQTYLSAGHPADALPSLRESLTIMSRLTAHHQRAHIHVLLADVAGQLGDTSSERGHLDLAVALYRQLGAPEEETLIPRLNALGPGPSATIASENDTAPS